MSFQVGDKVVCEINGPGEVVDRAIDACRCKFDNGEVWWVNKKGIGLLSDEVIAKVKLAEPEIQNIETGEPMFKPGDRVFAPKFGFGTVLSIDTGLERYPVGVRFDNRVELSFTQEGVYDRYDDIPEERITKLNESEPTKNPPFAENIGKECLFLNFYGMQIQTIEGIKLDQTGEWYYLLQDSMEIMVSSDSYTINPEKILKFQQLAEEIEGE